ncbi:hypothetical protein Bpfe_003078 [Biomphalaria pfeifferi]|uniref:Uncharacterized protein n=1 Tax=Biomphalaria pfeifferi TaxID=112525 RepID=A0AAD8C6W4_BIOPF|nr:hypothetical protein Bpfe_003078 [Biomphalaria pfeifferi]
MAVHLSNCGHGDIRMPEPEYILSDGPSTDKSIELCNRQDICCLDDKDIPFLPHKLSQIYQTHQDNGDAPDSLKACPKAAYRGCLPILENCKAHLTRKTPTDHSLAIGSQFSNKKNYKAAVDERSPNIITAYPPRKAPDSVLKADTREEDLKVECRPVSLTTKPFPEKWLNVRSQVSQSREEKCYNKQLSFQRSRFHHTSAQASRRLFTTLGPSWIQPTYDEATLSSHLLTRKSHQAHKPPVSGRSLEESGHQLTDRDQMTWTKSTCSEPTSYRDFTYVDRVVRWLCTIPSNPLVNKIDCDSTLQEPLSRNSHLPSPRAASPTLSRAEAIRTPNHSFMSPFDVLSSSRCLPGETSATVSPTQTAPTVTGHPASLCVSQTSFAEMGALAKKRSETPRKLYPINSVSYNSVEDMAPYVLNMSPRPPNPSPCTTDSDRSTRRASSLCDQFASHIDGVSFDSSECTFDNFSIKAFISPKILSPFTVTAKILKLHSQPNVNVKYRKQRAAQAPHVIRLGKRKPKRIASNNVHTKLKKRRRKPIAPAPLVRQVKKKKLRKSSKKKKKNQAISLINKAIVLLRHRKKKKPATVRRQLVLKDLSPRSVSPGASSDSINETFQKVVGMTAQLRLEGKKRSSDVGTS